MYFLKPGFCQGGTDYPDLVNEKLVSKHLRTLIALKIHSGIVL